ncbi:MAG: hypothetical protein RJB13_2598, partial [Pseudomonadota bacterium]
MATQAHSHRETTHMIHLETLAEQIHSASENESFIALAALVQEKSNDSARYLIEAYLQCHWRDTKIAIIKSLGRNGGERAVAFLLDLTRNQEDIGLLQEVLLALGETKSPLAATYLLE